MSVFAPQTDFWQAGNDKYDLERAEREAKEKLMAKRKLQALDQKKETQGNPPDEDPENESQESGEEVEDNDIPETIAGKIATEESIRQPSNGDQSKKKDKQSRTRRGSKAEKQAKKRKREQHDQTGQQPKKKKSGKSRSKQN